MLFQNLRTSQYISAGSLLVTLIVKDEQFLTNAYGQPVSPGDVICLANQKRLMPGKTFEEFCQRPWRGQKHVSTWKSSTQEKKRQRRGGNWWINWTFLPCNVLGARTSSLKAFWFAPAAVSSSTRRRTSGKPVKLFAWRNSHEFTPLTLTCRPKSMIGRCIFLLK